MTMMTSSIVAFPLEPHDWLKCRPGRCKLSLSSMNPLIPGLKSVLLPVDCGRMVNCREWVSDALATVTPDSYGYDEKSGGEAVE